MIEYVVKLPNMAFKAGASFGYLNSALYNFEVSMRTFYFVKIFRTD